MIYVDVSDGVYRTSIGGDKIPMESLRNARACVKSQQGPSSLIVQSKKAGAFVSIVEARTLSATIAERTPHPIIRIRKINATTKIMSMMKIFLLMIPPQSAILNLLNTEYKHCY